MRYTVCYIRCRYNFDIIFACSVYFTCWYPSIKPLPENNRAAPDNHSENACYPTRNTLAIFTGSDPIQPVRGSTCVRFSTRRGYRTVPSFDRDISSPAQSPGRNNLFSPSNAIMASSANCRTRSLPWSGWERAAAWTTRVEKPLVRELLLRDGLAARGPLKRTANNL